MNKGVKINWKKRLLIIFGSLIVSSFLLRVFVFEIYKVSENSMNNTYSDGDRILVNKLAKSGISRNEVLVFHYRNNVFVKRCVGLPGETVEIKGGVLFADHKKVPFPSRAIPSSGKKNSQADNTMITDIVTYDLFGQKWSKDDFGPYIIPKKGMTITLTPENIKMYKKLLNGQNVILPASSSAYTFQEDCYFVVGDNRPNSEDSRIFGAIRKKDIIGVVSFSF